MKQLLPYFMFFVVFALVLVECARKFPSGKMQPNDSLSAAEKPKNSANKEKSKLIAQTYLENMIPRFENKAMPVFKSIAPQGNIVRYIDGSSFNKSGINFNYLPSGKTFKITAQQPLIIDLSILPAVERAAW
jgi:hypothetical protein